MRDIRIGKYIISFMISVAIFASAVFISNVFAENRIKDVRNIEDRIYMDILSTEIQFSLLEEISCDKIDTNFLSQEMKNLSRKLAYTEETLGTHSDEVKHLKRYYSLLLIKDYLLMKKVSSKCEIKPVFVLYFYSNEGDCSDCTRQGHVLTYLSEKYSQLRVYAFDYNLDVPALQTLIALYEVEKALPALIFDGEVYYGFMGRQKMENMMPETISSEEDSAGDQSDDKAGSTPPSR
jgi:hypothetical protein